MATNVKLTKILAPNFRALGHKNAKVRARFVIVDEKNPATLVVEDCFPNGTVFVRVYSYSWYEIAKTAIGLLDEESNFSQELENVYPGVKFKDMYLKLAPCESIHITKDSTIESICKKMNEINEKELYGRIS